MPTHDIYGLPHAGKLRQRIYQEYLQRRADCALVTASDSKHAPYLFNTIASIQSVFSDHPVLHVFDLGLSRLQRQELSSIPWVRLHAMERFAPHWKQNWSWKPYLLKRIPQRYVFYFDASNIVLYRPLVLWFWTIMRRGYFLIRNDQSMYEITPPDYYDLFGCSRAVLEQQPTFGAGLMGFDLQGFARPAIEEVLQRTIEGWNLGRSANEVRNTYDHSVIRQCKCFRADQTLLNLAIRKHLAGDRLVLRNQLKYCGLGGPADAPRQYLWYSRRRRDSLLYFWNPAGTAGLAFALNRLGAYCRISARYYGGRVARTVSRALSTLRGHTTSAQ